MEMKEIEIEAVKYQITKMFAKDSYDLYLQSISILAPIFLNKKKETGTGQNVEQGAGIHFDAETVTVLQNAITNKFSYEYITQIIKKGIKKNYQEISDAELNVSNPLLLIELFIHILKHNVFDELLKKDFGAIMTRLTGSSNV